MSWTCKPLGHRCPYKYENSKDYITIIKSLHTFYFPRAMQHNFVLKFNPNFPTHYSLTVPKFSPHYIPTSPTVPAHYSPTLPNLSPYSTYTPFPPCHSTPVIHLFHLPSSLLSHLSQLTSLPATNRHLQNRSLLSLSRQGKHVRLIVTRPLMKTGWWDARRSNQHHREFTISNIEKSALPGNDYG